VGGRRGLGLRRIGRVGVLLVLLHHIHLSSLLFLGGEDGRRGGLAVVLMLRDTLLRLIAILLLHATPTMLDSLPAWVDAESDPRWKFSEAISRLPIVRNGGGGRRLECARKHGRLLLVRVLLM
jgi:hypothetical protein